LAKEYDEVGLRGAALGLLGPDERLGLAVGLGDEAVDVEERWSDEALAFVLEKIGSHRTRRWRKGDSNRQSLSLALPDKPSIAVVPFIKCDR
jgi:hypothetical protein